MPTGFKSKFGLYDGYSAWNDSWTAVDEMLPFNDESVNQAIDFIENNVLEGKASRRAPDQGFIKVGGAINGDFDYNNFGSIIKAAMGAEAGGVYTFSDALDNIIGVEFEKTQSRWRTMAKINELTIEGQKNEGVKISIGLVGKQITRSATAFPALSISSQSRVLFSQLTYRIGNQDDALAGGDELEISSFRIHINNNLADDHGTNAQRTILEANRNGFRTVEFEIGFDRYASDAMFDWFDAGTKLQSDLTFTDGSATWLIEIPEIIINGEPGAPIGGPEIIAESVPMSCYRNTSNTPMTAIDDEVRMTLS